MQETMPGYAFGLWYDYDPATRPYEARVLLTIGHALQDEQPSIAAARQALAARTSRLFEAEKIDAFLTQIHQLDDQLRSAFYGR